VTAALPLGMPKFIVSTVAYSHLIPPERLAPDLMMILWAGGLYGLNSICRSILGQAAGAVLGASRVAQPLVRDRPRVAISSLGKSCLSYMLRLTPALEARVMREIVEPTVAAMRARGAPYRGVLYAGLMITAEGPKLIEYNCRFGDPETQVLTPRLAGDLVSLMIAACDGALDGVEARWRDEAALTVVMAAQGYPGTVERGSVIRGVAEAERIEGVTIFHAGTAARDGALVAQGGRVLNVTAVGRTVAEAQARAYAAVERIDWPEGFCRRDIGWRAIDRG